MLLLLVTLVFPSVQLLWFYQLPKETIILKQEELQKYSSMFRAKFFPRKKNLTWKISVHPWQTASLDFTSCSLLRSISFWASSLSSRLQVCLPLQLSPRRPGRKGMGGFSRLGLGGPRSPSREALGGSRGVTGNSIKHRGSQRSRSQRSWSHRAWSHWSFWQRSDLFFSWTVVFTSESITTQSLFCVTEAKKRCRVTAVHVGVVLFIRISFTEIIFLEIKV